MYAAAVPSGAAGPETGTNGHDAGRRGVVFEEYDEGPLRTEDGIATIAGNCPSKGTGENGA